MDDAFAKGSGSRDTATATVRYGSGMLLPKHAKPTDEYIKKQIDSLNQNGAASNERLRQLKTIAKLKQMSESDVVALIDSLFEAPQVPYALVNQINWYVENRPMTKALSERLWFETDTSPYPAHSLYDQWNVDRPNPYSSRISSADSSLYLVLSGTEKLGEFTPPIKNVITSKFGWRDGRAHKGIDIDLEVWDPVVSAFPGMIRVAKYYGGYGRVVVVRHFNGLETTYAHLHRIKVKPGQVVKSGEVIGLGGSSGHSTGSHLHFECRFKGVPLDPQTFISFKEDRLLSDTLMLRKTPHGYASFPKGAKFHTVKKGEFLSLIARRYGVTIAHLCRVNGIRKNTVLYVGRQLRII